MHRRLQHSRPDALASAFTLIELLVSMSLLTFVLIVLAGVTDAASRAWRGGQSHTETFQSARAALEIMARELTPAVVDTRMQFVVAPGTLLTAVGATHLAEKSPVVLWMAPLGEDGSLRCVGYFLTRDNDRKFFRLKRLFIAPPQPGKPSAFFPKMVNAQNPRDATLKTSPVDARWFTRAWNADAFDEENPENTEVVVSSAADGVVGLWVQCVDLLGHPIPRLATSRVHPHSTLDFNSAAYFQVATTRPFEDGSSFQFLAETPQTMKANRLPAAVEFTLVIVENRDLLRVKELPEQVNIYDEKGTLDVEASTRQFEDELHKIGIHNAHTFSTRARLVNGS